MKYTIKLLKFIKVVIKMKNFKYVIIILIPIFLLMIYGIYTEITCSLDNCDDARVKGGKYCLEHTCETENCFNQKSPGSYCCYTCIENDLNNNSNKITLTDTQVQKAKEAIAEYTKMLMEKQSNILAVNLLNDYPEWVSETSCSFRCNVVREDDNTNLAEIYLDIKSDGTFEVDKLLYD